MSERTDTERLPGVPLCLLGGRGAYREVIDGKFLKRREDIDCTCLVCRQLDARIAAIDAEENTR